MTFARLRALVIVGALFISAVVFVGIAIAKDKQTRPSVGANCPTGYVMANLKLPDEPKDIKINVYNATDQPGLAQEVANELRARKFTVGQVGNDPLGKHTDEVAVLRYGPKTVGAAWVVRAYFLNEAAREFDLERSDDTVDIVLGSSFKKLATETEMRQALTAAGPAKLEKNTCDANSR
jgi:LytR cell envelope-related transcriptional attenuator